MRRLPASSDECLCGRSADRAGRGVSGGNNDCRQRCSGSHAEACGARDTSDTRSSGDNESAQTTRASVSDKSTSSNEGTVSELPVLSPDGESTAEISESSSDSSISDDKDSSDTQTMAQGEIGTSDQKSDSSSLPIIVAVICGVVVLTGAAVFAILKRGQ